MLRDHHDGHGQTHRVEHLILNGSGSCRASTSTKSDACGKPQSTHGWRAADRPSAPELRLSDLPTEPVGAATIRVAREVPSRIAKRHGHATGSTGNTLDVVVDCNSTFTTPHLSPCGARTSACPARLSSQSVPLAHTTTRSRTSVQPGQA